MDTRSKQREAARARRVAAKPPPSEQTRRQRRLQLLRRIALGTVIVVALAIASSRSNGGSSGLKTGAQARQLASQVNRLLSGISQSGTRLGNPSAPVTLIYYGDLECPVCKQFTLNGGFPGLVSGDVRSGKVQVVYRGLKTATPVTQTFKTQQVAALAAGRQNHFWDFAELFYRQQGAEGTSYVTDNYLTALARQIPGLDLSTWRSDRTDPSLVRQVVTEEFAAVAAKIAGTPTLIIEGPKGRARVPQTVPSYNQLQTAIKAVS